jgi:glycerophosphoryl diester phosphodiesterase
MTLPIIVAHRGESHDAPENTLAAFRLAWDRGAAMFELDVHLTADGELAVIHDSDTRRTTGVSMVVERSTMAELRKLDAGLCLGDAWEGERIPTLGEALRELPAGCAVKIELKGGPELVQPLARVLGECGTDLRQVIVISFNLASVVESRRVLPAAPAYLITGFARDAATGEWSPTLEDLILKARSADLQGLCLSVDGPVDRAFVERCQRAGLGVNIWTVDDPELARKVAAMGPDSLTSNRASWIRAQLAAAPRE